MKKVLLALSACAVFTNVDAQIFSENFAGGIPSSFNLIDVDGKTPNAQVNFVTAAWVQRVVGGDTVACSNSWYAPPGQADDWMVTPSIAVPSTGTYLIWEAGAPDQNFPDGYMVYVSTTGNTVADFTAPPIYTNTGEDAPFVTRVADLSAYSGQTIYIAFRNNSTDKFLLYIDDLLVDVFTGYDVSGVVSDLPDVMATGSSHAIIATFTNEAGPFNSADFNYTVNGGAVSTASASALNVDPTETFNVAHSTAFNPSSAGSYTIKMWLSNIDGNVDANPSNDTITKTVYVVDNPPTRKVVSEEKTGTWCGWCPRGLVGMEYMASTYPNTTIPIAVHNADPMVVTGYDGNNFIGLVAEGGYPGGTVDRTINSDPNVQDLDLAYNERMSVVPTAGVVITNHTYNATTKAITLDAEATFAIEANNADFRFALVVIEDSVTGTSAGYAQENYYSFQSQNIALTGGGRNWQTSPATVPANEMVYNHVARGIFPSFFGASGSVPATITQNQTVNHTFTVTLPNKVNNPGKVHLAVLLLDNSDLSVVNADWVALDAGIGIDEASKIGFKTYPNPAKDILNITGVSGAYEVTLFNSVGQEVKSASYNDDAELNIEGLGAGMYILQVTADGVSQSKRISIVK